jgi:hypothetical protein
MKSASVISIRKMSGYGMAAHVKVFGVCRETRKE